MEYITHRRFKQLALCGPVNLPYGTECTIIDDCISTKDGEPLCLPTSENAYQYFSRNDDGRGLERGKLITAIKTALEKRDSGWQERWDKVWADLSLWRFKRREHQDHWIWNYDFYNAEITDLQRIAALVGAKGVN